MRFRERLNDNSHEEPQNPGSGEPTSGNLERLRKAGEDCLSAGDEAIKRAISGDSTAFLNAARQTGGQ
jgi:hypothetical protein